MTRFVVYVLLVVFLVIVEVSFLSTWPAPISSLNLILSFVIFMAVIIHDRRALGLALGSGLMLEPYSGFPFGITTVGLLSTVIGVNFLFKNFFTNRSFYSLLVLGLIGSVGYNAIIFGLNTIAAVFGLAQAVLSFDLWSHFVWQPLLNVLVLVSIFIAYYFSNGRLRSLFIISP